MAGEKIMLGVGTVTVGGTALGMTRGGSVFTVEREFRDIVADGDMGPVMGRKVLDREVARLTVNALELFTAANMTKYYPATTLTTGTTSDTYTGSLKVVSGDYADVVFTGSTLDGKDVTITLEDAINTGNLEWTFEDKNEVVPSLEYTAHYTTNTTAPWKVVFEK